MQGLRIIEAPLRHPPTNRSVAVVRVASFWEADPVALGSGKYVLLVGSERSSALSREEVARAWVAAGASYICAWGPNSEEIEETFDYSAFLPELGEPLSFTLMTTSHGQEEFEEALWFAFYSATPPDDLGHELKSVVVVVDSEALEAKAVAWVLENRE